jgi:nucleoside recognition membrane protein YjiH
MPQKIIKFIIMNAIGIFLFFIPISMMGNFTIPLDHILNALKFLFPNSSVLFALFVIIAGGIYPFFAGSWNKNKISVIFSIFKVFGVVIAIFTYFNFGPAWLLSKDMSPFLFEKLVVSVGLIVPLGAILLSFLIDYGLFEFCGVLMQPTMRKSFKTPGKSAINALASFIGSYSVGLMITDKVYQEGYYTSREAAIIATGFSTISVTFMIIVARTVGIIDDWNHFFWPTIVITFVITAITVRLYPLRNIEDKFLVNNAKNKDIKIEGGYWKTALSEGLAKVEATEPMHKRTLQNLKTGIVLTMNILPMIMSVGLIGLMLNKYTPVFEYLGFIFYPFAVLVQVPEPLIASKAIASSIAEMFLPALFIQTSGPLSFVTRYTAASISISSIIFFSASIPCILATAIPLNLKDLIIIWFERVILGILLTVPVAYAVQYFIH